MGRRRHGNPRDARACAECKKVANGSVEREGGTLYCDECWGRREGERGCAGVAPAAVPSGARGGGDRAELRPVQGEQPQSAESQGVGPTPDSPDPQVPAAVPKPAASAGGAATERGKPRRRPSAKQPRPPGASGRPQLGAGEAPPVAPTLREREGLQGAIAEHVAQVAVAAEVVSLHEDIVNRLKRDLALIDEFVQRWPSSAEDTRSTPNDKKLAAVLTALREALETVDNCKRLVASQSDVVAKLAEELSALENGPDATTEKQLDRAEKKLERAKTDLRDAKADLERAETKLERAKTDLDRAKTDLDRATSALDRAKAELDHAHAQVAAAKKQLREFDAALCEKSTTVASQSNDSQATVLVNDEPKRCCFCGKQPSANKPITRAHIMSAAVMDGLGPGSQVWIPLCGTRGRKDSCHDKFDEGLAVLLSRDEAQWKAVRDNGRYVSRWVALILRCEDPEESIREFELKTPREICRTAVHIRSARVYEDPAFHAQFAVLFDRYLQRCKDRKASTIQDWMHATQTPPQSQQRDP